MKYWLCLFVMCMTSAAPASELPLTYSRETITIKRARPALPESLPWQTEADIAALAALTVTVEMRDAANFSKQEGWFHVGKISGPATLVLYSEPGTHAIRPAAVYTPLDVLMIDKEGIIREIAPKLVPAEMSDAITPKTPITALLLMPGGTCETQHITPGDVVAHAFFKKPPPVLTAP